MPESLILESSRVEFRQAGRTRVISGYAARVYRKGKPGTEYERFPGFFERVAPGAFAAALARSDPRALVNHDPGRLLGRLSAGTLRVEARDDGLWYEIDVPATQFGDDALESVRRGDMTGSSIQFVIERGGRDEFSREERARQKVTIRTIHDMGEILDLGPVTFPAFQATTAQARSALERGGRGAQLAARQAELRAMGILK